MQDTKHTHMQRVSGIDPSNKKNGERLVVENTY